MNLFCVCVRDTLSQKVSVSEHITKENYVRQEKIMKKMVLFAIGEKQVRGSFFQLIIFSLFGGY